MFLLYGGYVSMRPFSNWGKGIKLHLNYSQLSLFCYMINFFLGNCPLSQLQIGNLTQTNTHHHHHVLTLLQLSHPGLIFLQAGSCFPGLFLMIFMLSPKSSPYFCLLCLLNSFWPEVDKFCECSILSKWYITVPGQLSSKQAIVSCLK